MRQTHQEGPCRQTTINGIITQDIVKNYFKDIFVSEEVGYQKPMKEYFDFVFERIPNFSREKTMIIGDSLHSDIQGGQQAKIQTVWLNPTSAPATPTIQPNYTIQQLDELLPILGH